MPATPLPASGEHPRRHPEDVRCQRDGRDPSHVPARLRRGARSRARRRARATPTTRRSSRPQLETLSIGVHAHHEGEDETALGCPRGARSVVHRARRAHEGAARRSCSCTCRRWMPRCRRGGRRAKATDAEPVLGGARRRQCGIAVHLPDEEANIVPVMEYTITEAEVEWFAQHGRKATPKGQTWQQLGEILASQPDGGDEWLHKHMPAPVRARCGA